MSQLELLGRTDLLDATLAEAAILADFDRCACRAVHLPPRYLRLP